VAANGIERCIGQMLVGVDEAMGNRLDRRRMLRTMALVGAAAVAGGVVKAMPAGAAAGSGFRTTKALKLRAKPSTSAAVLLVMPKGALLKDLGTAKNGFEKVEYEGTQGWANISYLESTNPDANPPKYLGTAVTTANVNLREGPSTNNAILEVVPKGTTVKVYDKIWYGFRLVKVGTTYGWMFEEYLQY
jgi:uncharacterized protein YraI